MRSLCCSSGGNPAGLDAMFAQILTYCRWVDVWLSKINALFAIAEDDNDKDDDTYMSPLVSTSRESMVLLSLAPVNPSDWGTSECTYFFSIFVAALLKEHSYASISQILYKELCSYVVKNMAPRFCRAVF
mmetsp:Transcript_103375/g.179392  ORF Transcript_103375/g.179392 Transcript_103375/m.179392 type:complete len:130 (+) Transcript_103375:371-760(+)